MVADPQPFPTHVEDRLEFETLIADTSAALISAPPEQVEQAVEHALDGVRVFFQADRCGLLSVSADEEVVRVIHASYAPGVSEVSGDINLGQLFPWCRLKLVVERVPVRVSRMTELPSEAAVDRASWHAMGTRSNLTIPIALGSRVTHLIVIHTVSDDREWPDAFVARLRVLGEMMATALERQQSDEALRRALSEVRRLRDLLERENSYLRGEAQQRQGPDRLVGRSGAIRRALTLAEQVAATNSTVLLLGETGVGKERFASLIHDASRRRGRTMIRVNCSAIPTALIESELFGREKGAYTGSLSKQIGRFELAHGSTLFLDEIGDLPLDIQVKLLRVLEERTIERLGNPRPVAVDVRIIVATHRDLEEAVQEGTFREDLYYRLNVFPITVPPLRERRDDIPLLVTVFVEEFAGAMGKRIDTVDPASMALLLQHTWPGNVRELRNAVERAVILASGPVLRVETAPGARAPAAAAGELVAVERAHIVRVLQECGWRIRGPHGAAARLGLKATTLESRLSKLGIVRPRG